MDVGGVRDPLKAVQERGARKVMGILGRVRTACWDRCSTDWREEAGVVLVRAEKDR